MSTSLCIAGEFTNSLAASYTAISRGTTYNETATTSTSNATNLVHTFTQAEHTITMNEASEILKTVAETVTTTASTSEPYPGQEPGPERGKRERINWETFCVCCTELIARKQNQTQTNKQRSRHRRVKRNNLTADNPSENRKYDVFLGGSCNPTSWRKDIVIPHLLKEGVTFYNPVDEWYPELIEVEERAKEAASRLLYVIDDQTRAVASMIEVADFIGSGRDVLVVVDDIIGESPTIGGDVLSHREVEDLNRGRMFVRMITGGSAGGSVVESNIHRAVGTLVDISRWGQETSDDEDTPTEQHQPHEFPSLISLLHSKLRLLELVHTMYDTDRRGHLTLDEAEWALLALECNQKSIQKVWDICSDTSDWLLWKQDGISLKAFCILYAETRNHTLLFEARKVGVVEGSGERRESVLGTTAKYLRHGLKRVLTGWLGHTSLPPPSPSPSLPHTHYDIYLGGSCGTTSWRQDDIIPILRHHGVTFFNPQVSNWDTSLISIEQTAQNQCSVLLYVISGDTLSVASMVEVAYYIGQHRRLVLSISDIPQHWDTTGTTYLKDLKLTQRAVRDYNRGRAYLTSIAKKRQVPIYTSSIEATLCAVYIAKGYDIPTQESHDINIPLQGTSV